MKKSEVNFLPLYNSNKQDEKRKKFFFFFSDISSFALRSLLYLLVILFFVGVILFFIEGIKTLPLLTNVYAKTMAGKGEIEKIEISLKEGLVPDQEISALLKTLSETKLNLTQAKEDFENAKEELRELGSFKKIPWLGTQLKVLDDLLTAALRTCSSLEKISIWLDEALKDISISFLKPSPQNFFPSLSKLKELSTLLEKTEEEIEIIQNLLVQIPEKGVLDILKKTKRDFQSKLSLLERKTKEIRKGSQFLSSTLGLDKEEKIYLLLFQNNTELRPTGGFLGSYGILKIKNGKIDLKTDDIYNLDKTAEGILKIEPPWPLKKYNKVPYWFMRDANWSPDFPTSAQKVNWFYLKESKTEEKINGVIAFDLNFVSEIFEVIGPIKIKDLTFHKNNFADLLQYEVEVGFAEKGIPPEKRKEIIQDLAKEMEKKIFNLSFEKWQELYKIIKKNLEEKHILFYFYDQNLENYVLEKNWGGEIKDFEGDFLMVIDANLASLKTDPVVKKSINYKLSSLIDSEPKSKLTISYDHQGEFSWKITRYRTYTRVYLPKGSELIKGEVIVNNKSIPIPLAEIEITQEFNKTVFGTFLSIEPKEKKTLSFEYKLPKEIHKQILDGYYSLFAQKQPGTEAHILELNLEFPKNLKSASPSESKKEWGDAFYRLKTDLRKDREVKVRLN